MNAERDASQLDAGFTLLELLIAISLMSILAVLLLGGFRFGTRVWERAETSNNSFENAQTAQIWLRRELSSAYPEVESGAPRLRVKFAGMPNRITFLGPGARTSQFGGRAWVQLYTQLSQGHVALIADETPELAPASGQELHEEILVGFSSISFSYFGSVSRNERPSWHDYWTDMPRLPDLVRISAKPRAGDPGGFSDFIVAPRITSDSSCIFDVLTRRCRGR